MEYVPQSFNSLEDEVAHHFIFGQTEMSLGLKVYFVCTNFLR